MRPEPRCYPNVPADDYHDWDACSSTALRAMLRSSPAHARVGILDSESPSLRLGTAVHTAILEPHRFGSDIRVEPKVDKRTKEGKALWESFEMSMMPGQTRISEEQLVVVQAIQDRVSGSQAAQGLLVEAAHREYSVVSEVEGVLCKARCDGYGGGLILDVKTTSGLAAHDEFAKTMWNFGYAVQAQFYRMVLHRAGLKADRFAWIVCETNAPHGVACYSVDADLLDSFEPVVVNALHRWADCEHTGSWPSYPDDVVGLALPAWMTKQLEVT
jgi:hypothetical protein